MVVKPKIRGFICTTAHPEGCAASVKEQINYVKAQGTIDGGPKKVLIIGASSGFGLSTRVVSTFGCGADTLGVFFERPSDGRKTATAGWYQSLAFEKEAKAAGNYAKSFNGDAFSNEMKAKVIDEIKANMEKVDLVIYSLAAPRRQHPDTGEIINSTLKTIGDPIVEKTINTKTGVISNVTIETANDQEVLDTISVMGGEDWEMWIKALKDADVLADGVMTVAYSYIGPKVTQKIYRTGTIGQAKVDLENRAEVIGKMVESVNGKAFISVNKALVTQASSAIPVMPLYINLLNKVMLEKGSYEECKEQMYRLFNEKMYPKNGEIPVDEKNRIRVDDWELEDDIQSEVEKNFEAVTTENIEELGSLKAYNDAFLQLFGFGFDGIDYEADVVIERDFS
jgi:enoyl-[acyl-carrier protein] reductase/trans-2-enoyl-CoA reductase (NAD+)